MPNHNISQLGLIELIVKDLGKRYKIKSFNCREYNAIIAACTSIVDELAKPEKPVTPDMGYFAWLDCDHTGQSSILMSMVLYTGGKYQPYRDEGNYPRDADDFGRCVGLLVAVPDFRERLHLMREAGAEWAAIVDHFGELEQLYQTGQYKVLSEQLDILTRNQARPARKAAQ